jgi:hypothetical protein
MFSAAISLQPSEMLSAWRRDTARLLLHAPAAPPLRQKAALRIQLAGQSVGATIVGTVVSVHREGKGHRIELAPDADSLPALHMLLAGSRGEPIPFLQRSLRYLVRMPVVVASAGAEMYMTTYCVSAGGCGLKWSGPLPAVGQRVRLRFGAAARVADMPGTVCWLAATGSSPTAGVRFDLASGPPVAWGRMFADVARSGAPMA